MPNFSKIGFRIALTNAPTISPKPNCAYAGGACGAMKVNAATSIIVASNDVESIFLLSMFVLVINRYEMMNYAVLFIGIVLLIIAIGISLKAFIKNNEITISIKCTSNNSVSFKSYFIDLCQKRYLFARQHSNYILAQ